jgi:hypothetical protein
MDNEQPDNLNTAIELARQKWNEFDYTIDLDDKKIKRYKGYASITFDLKNVGEFISLLLDIKEGNIKEQNEGLRINQLIERSLFVSSIVTYARCFTQTDGRGIKLESRDCFEESQVDLKRVHGSLLEIRNQYLAHAGVSNSERIFASANFNVIDDNEVSLRLSHEIFGQYGLDKNDMLTFLALVNHLMERTAKKRDEAARDYIESLTFEEKNGLLKKAYEKKNAR